MNIIIVRDCNDIFSGQLAGLEPFFDFIVSIGTKRLDKDDESFKEVLKQHIDKPLELTVYNR
jgi:FMN phosphatase YigB (HAD superfamily)